MKRVEGENGVTDEKAENEIISTAQAAKAHKSAVGANPEPAAAADPAKRWPIAAMGFGIGSAALAAALLYANRSRKR
jgi:hypothetical protein